MQRREFITLLGGTMVLWPSAARAQQPERMRRIGFLMGYLEADIQAKAAVLAFHDGLNSVGLKIGRNLQIDYRWAGGDPEKARSFARDLIALRPDLIVASTNQVVSILMAETKVVPIVFASVADPIGSRYAASFARPGANLTGFAAFEGPFAGKWLDLIKEISPQIRRVGFVYHPAVSPHVEFLRVAQATAPSFGFEITAIPVTSPQEIEERITSFATSGSESAIVVPPHALLEAQRSLIIGLATRYRMLGVYGNRFFAENGGLISLGINVPDLFRRAATYVDIILKGANPAELPVQLPTKFEMLINLKTAKALGVTVPSTLLARADEVIE